MNGKIVGSFVVITALAFGAVVYYTQLYAFYDEIDAEAAEIALVNVATGQPEPIVIAVAIAAATSCLVAPAFLAP